MATWEPDEIDFEDQYDKVDPIDDADLDTSMTLLNESIREQEELEKRIHRLNGHQRIKMNKQNWNNGQLLTRRNRGYTS